MIHQSIDLTVLTIHFAHIPLYGKAERSFLPKKEVLGSYAGEPFQLDGDASEWLVELRLE